MESRVIADMSASDSVCSATMRGQSPLTLIDLTFLGAISETALTRHVEFAYADTVGIPQDLLTLSWLCFVRAHRESGKRQKDWRATYRNAVRGNWYKVWYLNPATGECTLTSNGAQAQAEFA